MLTFAGRRDLMVVSGRHHVVVRLADDSTLVVRYNSKRPVPEMVTLRGRTRKLGGKEEKEGSLVGAS